MAIKLTFPVDATKITAPSLHQWDYGQILEIESADLAPYVEVHFACSGMTEAIARPCTVIPGIATVAIPDVCLEHAGTIMAWVFEINGTEGMTRKTITIPVIGRVKPVPGGDVPAESYDKYIELIAEFREAAAEVLAGNVTVVQAKNANYANYAVEAGRANGAALADEAAHARRAALADTALSANSAGSFYSGSASNKIAIYSAGIYIVSVSSNSEGSGKDYTSVIVVPDLTQSAYSTVAYDILAETSKKVSNQIQYEPQGTNEAGEAYGFLTIYHDADYVFEYKIACAVRITTLNTDGKG